MIKAIRDPYLYGTRYFGENGRSSEAMRCYAGEWMTCYFVDGKQVYFGKTTPNVTAQLAKSQARRYAEDGTYPDGMVPQGTAN